MKEEQTKRAYEPSKYSPVKDWPPALIPSAVLGKNVLSVQIEFKPEAFDLSDSGLYVPAAQAGDRATTQFLSSIHEVVAVGDMVHTNIAEGPNNFDWDYHPDLEAGDWVVSLQATPFVLFGQKFSIQAARYLPIIVKRASDDPDRIIALWQKRREVAEAVRAAVAEARGAGGSVVSIGTERG